MVRRGSTLTVMPLPLLVVLVMGMRTTARCATWPTAWRRQSCNSS